MPGFEAFFVPAVSENLLCRICHLPVRRAVQVSVCGHRFCDSCLNGALRTQRSGRLRCPVDSSSIDFSQIYADDLTNQMIMSLTVYCDYYQGGCKWKAPLKKLQDHLKDCKYTPVSCPNGCGTKVQKRKTADHVKRDCVKRRVSCSRCRREMSFEDVQGHSCPTNRQSPSEDLAPCSNGCGARIKRREMTRHLRADCVNRWIYCEHCGVEIVHRDRQDHQRTCRPFNARALELTRGGKRSSVSAVVRFDSRSMRSNSTTQSPPEPNPAPPWRSVSFPASLNFVGREDFGSQVIYRGSSRNGVNRTSEEEWDIFTCSCGERISRGQITNHMSDECPKRMTKCQYCHVQAMHEEMQTHLQVCTRFPLSCPNNCGVSQIPREEMDRHVAHNCRSNLVHCPFKHAGCNHQCPQPGIQQHLEEDVKKHLSLVSEIAIQQQKELNELRELVRHCRPFGHGKLLWKLDDFRARFHEGKKTKGVEVHSPPFYTSPCGYKFKVVIFPYGNGSGEGSHLSVYIRLLPGDYDALLKWPFEGEITLSLLDQSSDTRQRRHITQSFSPDPNWRSFQRPTKTTNTLGFGYPQYVSHRGLESSCYVKENCVFIKATVDCKHSVDV